MTVQANDYLEQSEHYTVMNMGLMAYLPFEESYTNANGIIEQRFSVNDRRVFKDATETFPFRNDTQLGSVAAPYRPEWNVAE